MRPIHLQTASLLILAATATALAAAGLGAFRTETVTTSAIALAIAAALHGAVLTPATRRRGYLATIVGWPVALWLCARGAESMGLANPGMLAVILEILTLTLAASLPAPDPWSERLARCRRAGDDVTAQLRLAPGLLPWLRVSLRRAFYGGTISPPAFAELAANVRDAETRLGAHLAHVVLPAHVRESLLTRARDLASQAELASIETSLALEHQALTAAVAFRDECARLDDLTDDQRDAIARGGQAFLVELATRPVKPGSPIPPARDFRDDVRH